MIACPSRERLERMLRDGLADGEAVVVEAHIERCRFCQQLLEKLTAWAKDEQVTWPSRSEQAASIRRHNGDKTAHSENDAASSSSGFCLTHVLDADALVEAPASSDRIVSRVGGYDVFDLLGHGGMGLVYRARDRRLKRVVALKMILTGAAAGAPELERFRIEVEAAARLQHPNIVQVFEVGEQDGRPFYSMEYAGGGSLAQRLRGTPLAPQSSAQLVETLARAMHAAHQRGVIHRDLKPANVLFTSDGTLKVSDFGLAKIAAEGSVGTQSGSVIGTPSYMAPEQASGRPHAVGPAADVYALGAILYDLLTGRPPFRADTPLETLRQVVYEEPVAPRRLLPRLSRDLETICLKSLQKEPQRRYPSALELAEDLRRYLDGKPISARPVGILGRTARWARRNPLLAATAGAAAALLVAAAALSVSFGLYQRHAAETVGRVLRQERAESANVAMDRALELCDRGEVRQGLLWLNRSLEIADQAHARELETAVRANLTSWQTRLHPLAGVFPHAAPVDALAISPDGRLMATGGDDGAVRLWDAASQKPIGMPIRHSDCVRAVMFSADGKLLLSVAGADARVSDVGAAASCRFTVHHSARITAAGFAPGGGRFLTAGDDGTGRLWDPTSGAPAGPILVHGGAVKSAAFSPDGKLIVTGGDDGIARLWDAGTARPVGTPLRHGGSLRVAIFHPSGRQVLTGSSDGTIRLWDAVTGRLLTGPMRHKLPIKAAAFSPDGKYIATASREWSARLWRTCDGAPCAEPLKHHGMVSCVSFSPDGKTLLTAGPDGQPRLWDVATGAAFQEPLLHEDGVTAAVFAPDGKSVFTGSRDGTACRWGLAPRRPERVAIEHAGWVYAAAFSLDGDTLALAGEGSGVGLWSLSQRRVLAKAMPGAQGITTVAFSRDGRFLLAGGEDRQVRVWDIAGKHPAGMPMVCDEELMSLALSPDGRTLVTGERDGTTSLWDMGTQTRRKSWQAHVGPVCAVAFAASGERFATGGADHLAKLWDARTGEAIGVSVRHRAQVFAVAFSPDGSALLTGSADDTAQLWDPSTGKALGAAIHLGAAVRTVEFSQDGRTMLIGGLEKYSCLYDRATAKPLGPHIDHRYAALAARFSEDGRRVLMTGEDKTLLDEAVPETMTGDIDEIGRLVRKRTGLRLDANGGVQVNDFESSEPLSRPDRVRPQRQMRPPHSP